MKLMGNTEGDKEYVSVCPIVVVNTSERGVETACREACGGSMQKAMESPEELPYHCVHGQKLSAFRDTWVLIQYRHH